MTLLSKAFGKAVEVVAVLLLMALAAVVVLAVVFRYVLNDSLTWYDEVASVLLAWITYFGASLAALRRAHLGFSAFVLSLPVKARLATFVISELITYAVFITLAWAGWRVLAVMGGMNLEGLPWVSFQFVQAIVPIGCALFVIAQLLSTPVAWSRLIEGRDPEKEEIKAEIAKAEAEISRTRADGER